MELSGPREDSLSITSESSQTSRISLGSKSTLLTTPALQTIAVKPIIQRNQYRHARVELGLYLLMDSEPAQSDNNLSSLPSARHQSSSSSSSSTDDYWNDCSETSISFDENIPSHLYTPRCLPLTQLIKNWWRYHVLAPALQDWAVVRAGKNAPATSRSREIRAPNPGHQSY
ncbi:uncharacterized protein PGTG_01697 [Puccinia graminis f. sp. tritici CRL 75-36-700-3]|uniref:Uncharacterized protein n=1 Tax=Puccinia graminis f. sp. tritici (strain CRL 75-36-700-3 / race SCCL) TaxID=418459 RepID=E3JSS9_PUCGT|nr:uncharacterized protein PGTG_01697 [Puccinia graminis f. sp. tritici CRL 75-36-700-3]EFP75104.1 hypothetical protein PGTG_01697 [Puccinia graminis f. sp. tritici CRL 75-36-700-3]